jgi:hypothetical protein
MGIIAVLRCSPRRQIDTQVGARRRDLPRRLQVSTCWQIVDCCGRRLALAFNSLSVVSESLNDDAPSSVCGTKSATAPRRKDAVLEQLCERALSLDDLSAVVRALNSLDSLSIQSLGFNGLSAGRQLQLKDARMMASPWPVRRDDPQRTARALVKGRQ